MFLVVPPTIIKMKNYSGENAADWVEHLLAIIKYSRRILVPYPYQVDVALALITICIQYAYTARQNHKMRTQNAVSTCALSCKWITSHTILIEISRSKDPP